jgi:purine-nucleoside phosphorylase
MCVAGPNYETKAEIRAFRRMGADAVGMSTAPELFEAARLKLKSTAISLISNMACGVSRGKLNHNEVKLAAESRKEDFAKLVKKLVREF